MVTEVRFKEGKLESNTRNNLLDFKPEGDKIIMEVMQNHQNQF